MFKIKKIRLIFARDFNEKYRTNIINIDNRVSVLSEIFQCVNFLDFVLAVGY
jgi:hypothetical protein